MNGENRTWQLTLIVKCVSCALVLAWVLSGGVRAQVLYGSITGNVTDNTGAVVIGATVKITHQATNRTRETVTNQNGIYTFPTVATGTYEVTVNMSGFKTYTRSGIEVTLNNITRVDITLDVGQLTETVSVVAEAPPLQTDRAEVRAELTARTLQELPLPPGRNYQQLFRTLPGITPPDNAHSVPTNPSRALIYNVNGTAASSNNVRIDGASQYNIFLPHVTAYVPALESIETVNVVTNSFDAEQGLAGGAAVNVQIKSGTNEIHGSAFEYHDNSATKAKPFFLPAGERKPKRVYNQYGGTIGGPIIKNRLFYFGSFEGTNDRQLGARFLTIPTLAMRNGDLSAGGVTIYDPDTGSPNGTGRTPFPGNTIPANRIDPIVRKILQDLPAPNFPGVTNNFYATAPYSFDRKTFDGKINWNVSDRFMTYGRFSFLNYDMRNPGALGPLDGQGVGPGGNTGHGSGNTYGVTVAGVYTFNPNFILDANVGWTRQATNSEQGFLDKAIGKDVLGIPGTNGTRQFENGWPRFAIAGFANLGVQDTFMPYYRSDPQWQYVANANWTRRSHNIRFGMDIAHQRLNHTQAEFIGGPAQPGSGGFNFGQGPTQLCTATNAAGNCTNVTTGNMFNAFATFLLGYHTGSGRTLLVDEKIVFIARAYSLYFRDQWQATKNLTMTLGTRWEYYPMPHRADRGLERYDFNTNEMLVCGVGGIPQDCGVKLSKRLFSPRLGLAWRASDTFVVRAGYGITYDPISLARIFRTNYPMLIALNVDAPNATAPAGRLRDGIPAVAAPNISRGRVPAPNNVSITTLGDRFIRPYIQSWNLTLEKSIGWGFTAQVSYVATRTIKQAAYFNVNAARVGGGNASRPLNAKFGRVADTTIYGPVGNSRYDSLQTKLTRQFSGGLQMNVAYTWSKTLGLSGVGFQNENAVQIADPAFLHLNRGLLNFDQPHNFQFYGIFELPFGSGRRWASTHKVASALVSGWQLNWVLSAFSGQPFNVTASGTSLNAPGNTQRADLVKSEVKKLGGIGRGNPYYDPFAFQPVTTTRFGTAAFNILRGPETVNLDLGLFRAFRVTERFNLQFRVEAFNATNTPHFGNPSNNVSNRRVNPDGTFRDGFMEITGTRSYGREGIDERVFRFGLRLGF